MKSWLMLIMLVVSLTTICPAKLFYTDSDINTGDIYDEVILKKQNTPPTVNMYGGEITSLSLVDGIFNFYGGTCDRIDDYNYYSKSTRVINILGGQLNYSGTIYNSSTSIHFRKGTVGEFFVYIPDSATFNPLYISEPILHIYGKDFDYYRDGYDYYLTGILEDGSAFSIKTYLNCLPFIELHDTTAPLCIEPGKSDINNDCLVNMVDFGTMAADWLSCGFADPNDC